ncbi:MAG: hypothetical protein JNG88_07785 [Phycisphaerales bacterium]|nr:hypothetical protein [Phycisphaerales bacterium]
MSAQLIGPPGAPTRFTSRELLRVLLLCLATRLVVWTAAYAGALVHVRIDQQIRPPLGSYEAELQAAMIDPHSALRLAFQRETGDCAPLIKWDSGHYRSIVESGYSYRAPAPGESGESAQSNIAFFPLYPLAARIIAPLVGGNIALVAVSNCAALALALLAYRWAAARTDSVTASLAAALIFTWPTAAFYSFAYAESTMGMLIAGAMLAADQRRWWLAAFVAGLATAARPTAVCFAPLLAWAHWIEHRQTPRSALVRAPLIALVAVWGAAAYAIFLTVEFGSPLAYFETLRAGWFADPPATATRDMLTLARVWDGLLPFIRVLREFPVGLTVLIDPMTWNMALSVALVIVSLLGWRRVSPEFRPYLLFAPLIFAQRYLSSGWSSFGMESMSRYVGVALPTFLLMAVWLQRRCDERLRATMLAGALLLQTAWAFYLGLGEWCG